MIVKKYLFIIIVFVSSSSKTIFTSVSVENEVSFQGETEQFEDMLDELDCMVDDAVTRGVLKPEIEFKGLTLFQRSMAPFAGPLIWIYVKAVYAYRGIRDIMFEYYKPIKPYMPYILFSGGKKDVEQKQDVIK